MVRYLRALVQQGPGRRRGQRRGTFRAGSAEPAGSTRTRTGSSRCEALEAALVGSPGSDASASHLLANLLYGLGRREEGLRRWRAADDVERPTASHMAKHRATPRPALHEDDHAALVAYDRAFSLSTAPTPGFSSSATRPPSGSKCRRTSAWRSSSDHPRDRRTERRPHEALDRSAPGPRHTPDDMARVSPVFSAHDISARGRAPIELHHAWVEVAAGARRSRSRAR